LKDSVLGLCIDYDELRTGVRNEAAFTMFSCLVPKTVSIFASALPSTILVMVGFRVPTHPGQADNIHQTEEVILLIRIMTGVIPTGLALLSVFFKYRNFPFTDFAATDIQIKAGLLLLHDGNAYLDPLTGKYIQPPSQPAAEWKRRLVLLNHFPSLETAQQMRKEDMASRGTFTVDRSKAEFFKAAFMFVCAATSTYVSVKQGLLSDPRLNAVPTLSIICTGLSLLASIVSALRYRAALELQKYEIPDKLLEHVIQERERAGEPGARQAEQHSEASGAMRLALEKAGAGAGQLLRICYFLRDA
jgi:hypothetical protein